MATDFAPDLSPARAPWGPGVAVGGVLCATFTLGFTEGCLEIERRPIPLRFALRYAAANVLPSVVWSSVPAGHVAAASGVPLSALVNEVETLDSRSVAVGKRLVLLKSVRALRLAVGSYGLAWSVWRWHTHHTESARSEEESVQCGERVVRLAPVNSQLSRASRRKHGEHIRSVPVTTESWKKPGAVDAVDWEKVGIEVQSDEETKRVKVIEVELRDAEMATKYAEELKAIKAARRDGASLCLVAVLPPCGPPMPTSIIDVFDVCFNPLSAVLTFIASVCHDRDITHVVLVSEEGDANTFDGDVVGSVEASSFLSTQHLVKGLLWRHGITATVLKPTQRKQADEAEEGDHQTENESELVVFISKSLRAGRSTAREQGLVAQQNACFIVEESLSGQRAASGEVAQSTLLTMATPIDIEKNRAFESSERGKSEEEENEQESPATYLSVADVSDQALQGIRKMVRQDKSFGVIQAAVYQAYGTQRVVGPPRIDQFSDIQV